MKLLLDAAQSLYSEVDAALRSKSVSPDTMIHIKSVTVAVKPHVGFDIQANVSVHFVQHPFPRP